MQYQLSRQLLLDEMAFSPSMLLCQETCYPNRSLFFYVHVHFKIRFSLINTILADFLYRTPTSNPIRVQLFVKEMNN